MPPNTSSFLESQSIQSRPLEWLQKLGRLPSGFDGGKLAPFLRHSNEKIRRLAIVNLAKLGDIGNLGAFYEIALNDPASFVRREATAAIGRMRSPQAIPELIRLTRDRDPNIVLQAMRGLFALPADRRIAAALRDLWHHPNEMIREVVRGNEPTKSDAEKDAAPHADFPAYLKNLVVHGDTLETLKRVPSESTHLTFTSPPYYNARDYSIYLSYEKYLDFLAKVFRQIYRVTKEGRFFILNTSPVIVPRLGRQYASRRYPIPFDIHPLLVKMGWEFIDDIVWAKPEASVKNRNGGFAQHRKPLGYKPNPRTEYLMVYRKKTARLIDWNMRQYDLETTRESVVGDGYETSNVWNIDPVFDKTHSAVFPSKLCARVVQYYSYRGDLICDPFGGSGTLGKTAACLGRSFFMVEKSPQYIARIEENLKGLFSRLRVAGEDEFKAAMRKGGKCR